MLSEISEKACDSNHGNRAVCQSDTYSDTVLQLINSQYLSIDKFSVPTAPTHYTPSHCTIKRKTHTWIAE